MTMLKDQLQSDMKTAMRGQEKDRLGAIRLILAEVKQREVDSRASLSDTEMLALLDKMAKQRRESIRQFEQAGRHDLVAKEEFELNIIQNYLPAALSEAELQQLIAQAIEKTAASSMRDMGKVMGVLKPQIQGRADIVAVSAQIKARLSA